VVTMAEAAELLHVSDRHIRRLIDKGELEATPSAVQSALAPKRLLLFSAESDKRCHMITVVPKKCA